MKKLSRELIERPNLAYQYDFVSFKNLGINLYSDKYGVHGQEELTLCILSDFAGSVKDYMFIPMEDVNPFNFMREHGGNAARFHNLHESLGVNHEEYIEYEIHPWMAINKINTQGKMDFNLVLKEQEFIDNNTPKKNGKFLVLVGEYKGFLFSAHDALSSEQGAIHFNIRTEIENQIMELIGKQKQSGFNTPEYQTINELIGDLKYKLQRINKDKTKVLANSNLTDVLYYFLETEEEFHVRNFSDDNELTTLMIEKRTKKK